MIKLFNAFFLLSCLFFASLTASAQHARMSVLEKIRADEAANSKIMDTAEYLTDVIGPRLTGSPNLRKAQDYIKDRLAEWGVPNAHREPWGPFGRGWSLEAFSASMTAPGFANLIAYPKAWSPGTNGTVRGEVVMMNVNTEADLAKYKGKLRGKIVLISPAREIDPAFLPSPRRTTGEELQKLADLKPPWAPPQFQMGPELRARIDLNYRRWQFLISEGAAVAVEPSAVGDAGTVYVTSASVPTAADTPPEQRIRAWDKSKPVIIPQIVVAAEQYDRMVRIIARGVPVEMEINIGVRYYEQDLMSSNLIAEIPGTDLKDEVVMIGGCLDSWHTGTGATDNAAGTAVAMEVLRIFKALGLKPRRTVRIGLWSAEEQGALGSRAYVAQHFGRRASDPASRSEYENFSGYFNMDYGTGKLRGVYLQGNEAVRPIFREWLDPFNDVGAGTLTIAGVGATDHNSFDDIGLPGFQFIRDFMETNPRTAHTNMDVYDHILEDDLRQAAVIAAYFIYQAAMRDEKLPRKSVL